MMTEREYDNLYNEGSEGYNPIREKRLAAERSASAKTPRTEYDILRELNALDCSIARESGIDNSAKIAALNAELAALRSADDREFLTEWTLDVTNTRRAEWNTEIQKIVKNGKVPTAALGALIRKLGYDVDDIKRAKKLHGIA